jgi:hypothetical protein
MSENNATYAQIAIENLELTNLAAHRQNRINELESQLKTTYPASDLLLAMQNALLMDINFLNKLVSTLKEHHSFDVRGDIDYTDLADSISYYQLAKQISVEDVASELDHNDIAECISVDYSDLAANIDYTDLADAIGYEDTIRDEVRERITDMQLHNVTISFS